MGICISAASSEIHEVEEALENVILYEASQVSRKLSSVYSKAGSKGLNQDAATLYQGFGMKDGAFCGVFDGHGRNGHIVSKIVSSQLPSLILSQKNALQNIDTIEKINDDKAPNHHTTMDDDSTPSKNYQTWREAILSAFKVMDKEKKLMENLDCSCSGTTAVVVIKQFGRIYIDNNNEQSEDLVIANLGDSRAVLGTTCDGRITALQLTTDLKPGLPSEADRIRRCNGRVFALKEEPHIQRVWLPDDEWPGLAMSRAFGDFMLKDHGIIAVPDVSCRRLTSNDQFIVLASDGVWDVLSNNEVASTAWATESEEAAAMAVVEAANSAWRKKYPSAKIDDCTVICHYLRHKPHGLGPCRHEELKL